MEGMAEVIIAAWLGLAGIFSALILLGFTIASAWISVPLWAVASFAISGGLVLSTAGMIGWGKR